MMDVAKARYIQAWENKNEWTEATGQKGLGVTDWCPYKIMVGICFKFYPKCDVLMNNIPKYS